MTKDEALALALHALHTKGEHHPQVYEAIYAIQTVLAQPPLLEQALEALTIYSDAQCSPKGRNAITALREALAQPEPSQWRDMVVVSLVREGINKHKARELADHFAAERNNG